MLFMRVTPHGSIELAHSELLFMQNPISFAILWPGFFQVLTFCCGKHARANSWKLDKQIVLLKKVIHLLANLHILDLLPCIESCKLG